MADQKKGEVGVVAESTSIQSAKVEKKPDQSSLWDKIKGKLIFWKKEAEIKPETVIFNISQVDVDTSEIVEPNTHQKILSLSNKIKSMYTNGGLPLKDKDQLIEIVDKAGFQFVGSGRESVVVVNPDNENEVVSIGLKNKSADEIQKNILTQAIMSKLFPHNFPEIRIQDEEQLVNEPVNPNIIYKKRVFVCEDEPNYKFKQVKDDIRELGLPVYFDNEGRINFVNGTDGGEYYLDNISTWSDIPWRPNLIEEYMKQKLNSSLDIEFVKSKINSLASLGVKVENTTVGTLSD